MPPITMQGVVTKVGYMNKTATVTVTRWIMHPRTRKVCEETRLRSGHTFLAHSYAILLQRYETSKKYLTHDPENSAWMS